MRPKALTGAAAILWGACMFLVGVANMRFHSYGTDFLQMMGSLYPGFHANGSFGEVLIGTVYGFVDGAVFGYLFGALYRWLAGSGLSEARPDSSRVVNDPTLLRRAS